jgi:hypothetical protein
MGKIYLIKSIENVEAWAKIMDKNKNDIKILIILKIKKHYLSRHKKWKNIEKIILKRNKLISKITIKNSICKILKIWEKIFWLKNNKENKENWEEIIIELINNKKVEKIKNTEDEK